MITVHHLEDSRSQRILWLLEELGVPYDVRRYPRDPETSLAPEALSGIHPLGKSPVIEDQGVVVAETAAIVEYLIDTYGQGGFRPARDTDDFRDYTYWLHFAEGTAMPQLLLKLFFTRIKEAPMPFFARPIARAIADKVLNGYVEPNLARQFSFINDHLASRDWFAGSALSGADIMMIFPLEAAIARGNAARRAPTIKAFVDRIHARPAYKAALEKGGAYAYA